MYSYLSAIAEEIKSSLATEDVLRYYGFTISRSRKMYCPFHADTKHPSMHIYPGSGGYHCFTCGASGDVISFVRSYFGLGFKDALEKLNADFSLGYPIGEKMTMRQKHKFDRIRAERENSIKTREENKNRLEREFLAKFDVWKQIDDVITSEKPKREGDAITDEYANALKKKDLAEYELYLAEREIRKNA